MPELSHLERATPAPTLEDITANGERVTHLQRDNCYYAHLSIYRFTLQFCRAIGSPFGS